MDNVNVIFEVASIKDEYEKYGKKFYPVSVKGIRGRNGGNYIFNCTVPIPKGTKYVVGTLYTYKSNFYIKNVVPFESTKTV